MAEPFAIGGESWSAGIRGKRRAGTSADPIRRRASSSVWMPST